MSKCSNLIEALPNGSMAEMAERAAECLEPSSSSEALGFKSKSRVSSGIELHQQYDEPTTLFYTSQSRTKA